MAKLLEEWSVIAATNGFTVPDGAEVGWKGEDVNEWGRAIMAVIRVWYDDPEWLSITRDLATRKQKTVSKETASSFRIADCNATTYFTTGRRVRMRIGGGGSVESHVASSNYNAPDTIVFIVGTNVPATFQLDGADVYFAKSLDVSAFISQPTVGDVKLSAALQSVAATNGWLECNGDEYQVAEYPELAAAVGADGSGNGYYDYHPDLGQPTSNYFRVPDLAGRVPVGFWDALTHPSGIDSEPDGDYDYRDGLTEADQRAKAWVGAKRHTLTLPEAPAHNHNGVTGTDGDHIHDVRMRHVNRDRPVGDLALQGLQWGTSEHIEGSDPVIAAGDHTHTIGSAGSGDDDPHETRQASTVMGYVIYSGVGA